MPSICIVTTSAGHLGPMPTGVWLEEVAAPYYIFKQKGFEVVFASILGGAVPIDAGSLSGDFFTDACKKFMHDGQAFGAFCHSKKVADIKAEEIDAIYLPGGHGCFVDFQGEKGKDLTNLVNAVYAAGKPVGADCHGPVGLGDCTKPDGTALVAGLTVTGFTNSEEIAAGFDGSAAKSTVAWYIEDHFKKLGGKWEQAADWNSKVCVDGKLVTGQNPQSSEACAEALVGLVGA